MFWMQGSPLESLWRSMPVLILTVLVGACDGGSGSPLATPGDGAAVCDPGDPATAAECGEVLVSVTDADGDFVSYSVDILSITLQRTDGSTVETLPAATRVDFAQLVDVAEILSATTLAPGSINGGTIRLDYSNAEVFIESGDAIVPVNVVDSNGQPLGITSVDIRLADEDRLVVTRGGAALLSIDFDLAASHTVGTGLSPDIVTARPYIVAEVRPVDEKEIRLRGALIDVDVDAQTYTIGVRPWHDREGDHGRVVVHTTPTTIYEIGEAMYHGRAGLEALSRLPSRTVVVAFGTLDFANREFTAAIVHAGLSVGGEEIDAVYGNVVARTGDQLVVKGAFAVHRDRIARFHRTILVNVGPETTVFKIDRDQLLTEDAISVGQRIVAFGELVEPDVAPADAEAPDIAYLFDATQGRVRLLVTHLYGAVKSVMPGQISLSLRGIDRLGIGHFDFSGTGMTPELDADPTDYEVATSTLALLDLATDQPAKVLGYVMPFGMAPPDFEGRTVVDHTRIRAALGIAWDLNGTTAPFLSMGHDGLVADLDNPEIGERHHMLFGRHHLVSLYALPGSPLIAPSDSDRTLYGISERGHVELFTRFEDFVDELALRLAALDGMRSMAAYGAYDAATNTLRANKIAVHMIPLEE